MVQIYSSERYLAYLYSIGAFASLLCTICMAVVWLHWRVVLNTCAGNFQSYASYYDEKDCGCILYARDTLTYFVGSDIGLCYWATFGMIIPLFFCFVFGCYHVYRVCCKSTSKPRRAKMEFHQRSRETIQMNIEQEPQVEDDVSPYFWSPATIVAIVMVLYTLVHSIMLTDGFFSTCKQYRNRVVKHVLATGEMVGVLQSRLSCGAIFDFMDYLQSDLSLERRRDYRINTAIPFILAVVAGWVVVFCWIGLLIVNFMRYRESRRLRI